MVSRTSCTVCGCTSRAALSSARRVGDSGDGGGPVRMPLSCSGCWHAAPPAGKRARVRRPYHGFIDLPVGVGTDGAPAESTPCPVLPARRLRRRRAPPPAGGLLAPAARTAAGGSPTSKSIAGTVRQGTATPAPPTAHAQRTRSPSRTSSGSVPWSSAAASGVRLFSDTSSGSGAGTPKSASTRRAAARTSGSRTAGGPSPPSPPSAARGSTVTGTARRLPTRSSRRILCRLGVARRLSVGARRRPRRRRGAMRLC